MGFLFANRNNENSSVLFDCRDCYLNQRVAKKTVVNDFYSLCCCLSVFGIHKGGACFSGPKADQTFNKFGESADCKNGRGGVGATDVYQLDYDGKYVMSFYLDV